MGISFCLIFREVSVTALVIEHPSWLTVRVYKVDNTKWVRIHAAAPFTLGSIQISTFTLALSPVYCIIIYKAVKRKWWSSSLSLLWHKI